MQTRRSTRLIVLLGVVGSGKSYLAKQIAQQIHFATVLDFDTAVITLHGDCGTPISHSDKHSAYMSMYREAKQTLRSQRDVIWVQALTQEQGHDSSLQPAARAGLRSLAFDVGAAILFIVCRPPLGVIKNRLLNRDRPPRSEPTWEETLERMERNWEPLIESHVTIDTSEDSALSDALLYIRSCQQNVVLELQGGEHRESRQQN